MQVSCRSNQAILEDSLCDLHSDLGTMPVMSAVQTKWYDLLTQAILTGDFSEIVAIVRRQAGSFVEPAWYIRRAVSQSIR